MSGNICNMDNIDWNRIWRQNAAYPYSVADWDERAISFSKYAIDSKYASNFIDFLQPQPDWTVFDMGCGSGTLALPLAETVQKVTAADFSPQMLAALNQYAQKRNLNNITTLKLSWTDSWEMVPDKSHDVAIASRSMLVEDFRGAVEKLIKVADRRVYLALPVNADPETDMLYRALGKKTRSKPDYSCCYNILYQMGIRANINILTEKTFKTFLSREDAMRHLTDHLKKDLNHDEMAVLQKYANLQLNHDKGRWYFKIQRPYQCAVIWWHVT